MSNFCQITGKHIYIGNRISHSNTKNKRRFSINLIKKRFFLVEKKKWIKLTVCAKGIRLINKLGLEKVLKHYKNGKKR